MTATVLLGVRAIEFQAPESWGAWIAIVAIAIACLFMSAFVSGSEIAYFGLTPLNIEELGEDEDDESALKAHRLIGNSERLLATILICNNLVNVTMVVLLTFAINQTVVFNSPLLNFLLQTVFLTFLLLLFGEIFPKLVAKGRVMWWVKMAATPLTALYNLFSPLAKFMVRTTWIVNKIVTKKHEEISTGDLESALEISDVGEGKEKEMFEGILSFGEKEAADIMTSRVDVTAIEYHDTWDEVIAVILEKGFSRIPVYDTSQDTIRGILYSKDLLPYYGKVDNRFEWQKLIRPAYFVPEQRMIDDLLEDFRRRRIHIAIVIDEYGGTRGLVTLEDIIEEIVGEIDDEYDEDETLYKRIGPDTYVFDAKIPLIDFWRVTDVDEEEVGETGDAETLAGLLLEIKGDFPKEKESLKWGRFRFLVLEIERHRIVRVRVNVEPESAQNRK